MVDDMRIGTFGLFRGKVNEALYQYLEDACLTYCGGMWIGVYSVHDVLNWAVSTGKITHKQKMEFINSL